MEFLKDTFGIKSIADLLAAMASIVAIITAIVAVIVWFLRRRRSKSKPKYPQSNLLHGLWDCLDSNLQDAFSLAFNHSLREGRNKIRTRDLFKSLVRLNDIYFRPISETLPNGSLPEPIDPSVGFRRVILDKDVCFSNCVTDSLERFTRTSKGRPINSADIFIDIAKYGNGKSVTNLRKHGVGPQEIEDIARKLDFRVIETKTKAMLSIKNCYATFPVNHPNTRICKGNFVILNTGRSVCNIEDLLLVGENIRLKYNLISEGHWPSNAVGVNGTRKLPFLVPVDKPQQLFFTFEEPLKPFPLPDTVVLEIHFDCLKKPIQKSLKRDSGGHQYRE